MSKKGKRREERREDGKLEKEWKTESLGEKHQQSGRR